ncbi:CDP-glycerol glycerophosphotransferase family protein [Enterovibrio norvegicus]|uniref:CDP-glycerol glycerophosphotransferase family protein n=1 Tax=Enterovibrio norvegicus TaxID=188144 RepID=UPI003D0B6483
MRLIIKFLILILRLIDLIYPKFDNRISLFASTGNFDANLKLVSSYIENELEEKYEVRSISFKKGTVLEKLVDCCYILSSKYMVIDHTLPPFVFSKRRRTFNVWHGIPIKTIRFFDESKFKISFLNRERSLIDGLVSSSDLDRAIMSASWQVPPNKVIVTGLPRNDILMARNGKLDWFVDVQEAELLSELAGRKLISWMPTYRGHHSDNLVINAFSQEFEQKLKDYLIEKNAVLGVRSHKFSTTQSFDTLLGSGLYIDLDKYSNTNTLLKYTNILITDYSSVWVDYSLISKNIILYLYDSESYHEERGVIYPIEKIFDGPIIYREDDIVDYLNRVNLDLSLTNHTPSQLFFKYTDSNNTKRFVECFLGKV